MLRYFRVLFIFCALSLSSFSAKSASFEVSLDFTAIPIASSIIIGGAGDGVGAVVMSTAAGASTIVVIAGGPITTVGPVVNGALLASSFAAGVVVVGFEIFMGTLDFNEVKNDALEYLADGKRSRNLDYFYDEVKSLLHSYDTAEDFLKEAGLTDEVNEQWYNALADGLLDIKENGLSKEDFAVSLQLLSIQ